MNEAEQFAKIGTMSKTELIKWQKYLAKNILEIESSIADTDKWSEREPKWKDDNDATNRRRRARMATRRRRLAQIERRIVEVESGAVISATPAAVDKDAQRVWRRLVADRREAMLYVAYAEKREDQRGLAIFQAKVDKLDEQMREIAEGAK